MSDELVVSQCAPTLAGLKTANMFSAEYESREEVTAELRRLNAVLVPRGLRIVPMRYMQSRVLLYLYRPEALRRDLADSAAQDILRECGYGKCSRAESCLSCLIASWWESAFSLLSMHGSTLPPTWIPTAIQKM